MNSIAIEITNVVIVRFSLILSTDWCIKAYGQEENREKWFKYRSQLFESTLLKSILNQSVKPKYVFILMHMNDKYLYDKYLSDIKFTVYPIFVSGGFGEKEIAKVISAVENIAVSRVDSDDLLANDYFQKINQSISEAIHNEVKFDYIISTTGYRLNAKLFQKIYYNCGPFLTSFGKNLENINIYSFSHEEVINYPHILNNEALWVQYIHGSNIANDFIDSNLSNDEFNAKIGVNPKLILTMTYPILDFDFSKFANFSVQN